MDINLFMEKLWLKIEPWEITSFFYNIFQFRGDVPCGPPGDAYECKQQLMKILHNVWKIKSVWKYLSIYTKMKKTLESFKKILRFLLKAL